MTSKHALHVEGSRVAGEGDTRERAVPSGIVCSETCPVIRSGVMIKEEKSIDDVLQTGQCT